MREPERDTSRLEHILTAISHVENYIDGITEEQLRDDMLHLHATIYNVQIIGEAVYKLTNEYKSSHSETPWRMIEKMRHILVHDYFAVDVDIMWLVIEDDIPVLKQQVEKYIKEFE